MLTDKINNVRKFCPDIPSKIFLKDFEEHTSDYLAGKQDRKCYLLLGRTFEESLTEILEDMLKILKKSLEVKISRVQDTEDDLTVEVEIRTCQKDANS